MTGAGIPVQEVARCPLCGGKGLGLYSGLRDRLCDVPGLWAFAQCSGCELLWLNPRPTQDALGAIYPQAYFGAIDSGSASKLTRLKRRLSNLIPSNCFGYDAKQAGPAGRLTGRLLGSLPLLRDMAYVSVRCIHGPARGRLLDVGCGDGAWLARMRELGWDVVGLEPSPVAAELARKRFGLKVFSGFLEGAGLGHEPFDVITLVHVIEHVPDPVGLLAECRELLADGGEIVVATPNLGAWAHKVFKGDWSSLDPPRHFVLFSDRSLRLAVEEAGFRVSSARSSAWPARGAWSHSRTLSRGNGRARVSRLDNLGGIAFLAAEVLGRGLAPSAGEELILTGIKGS